MRCFGDVFEKNINVDVFDDVLENTKHRADDASNDVNCPPLHSHDHENHNQSHDHESHNHNPIHNHDHESHNQNPTHNRDHNLKAVY